MSTSVNNITQREATHLPATGRNKQNWKLLAVIALVVMLVGAWTYSAVQETTEDHLTSLLLSTLQSNIEALQIVINNEKTLVLTWAQNNEVRELTERLLVGENHVEVVRELGTLLGNVVDEEGYLGFFIIDPQGTIMASHNPEIPSDTKLTAAGIELIRPALSGQAFFGKPVERSTLVTGVPGNNRKPLVLSNAPIFNRSDEVIAVLGFSIDPAKDFTRILSVAELGTSWDTYAFSNQGLMLSESRFEEQLKELELIPDTPDSSPILTLQLRDPGVDLTRGQRTELPISSRPLTHMAATAKTGAPGIDIDGYRDYRGVKVVGAWQWLPELGFGVATEVSRAEALRVLRPVRLAFTGLLCLLILTAIGIGLTGRFLNRLQLQIEELRELGQYTLIELIGAGGMGKVYKARHAMLRRQTAIKLIREDQINNKALERFEKEVQMTSQLTHPNTIAIYDYGHSPQGIFYYAMEYLSGITIGQLVKIEKQVPPERVIHLLLQIFGSLSEAHGQGLIHRDIKPGNIMLCQRGGNHDVVKVLDFGLVREIDTGQPSTPEQAQGIMGSPGFIAPELLVVGKAVDTSSDIYSVGALGYLMLTGQMVFPGSDIQEALHKTVNSDPLRPSEKCAAEIPAALDELIYSCLSRDVEQRPAALEAIEKLSTIELTQEWTNMDAAAWWQENSDRIRLERKLERPETSTLSETALDIDFGERPINNLDTDSKRDRRS